MLSASVYTECGTLIPKRNLTVVHDTILYEYSSVLVNAQGPVQQQSHKPKLHQSDKAVENYCDEVSKLGDSILPERQRRAPSITYPFLILTFCLNCIHTVSILVSYNCLFSDVLSLFFFLLQHFFHFTVLQVRG